MTTPEDRDLDARFDAIVSGLAPTMQWDTSPGIEETTDAEAQQREQHEREQELRRIRREQRRDERAQELAEFNADKAALEAEYNSADDHFTPPTPPPLPRLRRATVGALVLIALGVALVAVPGILNLGQQLTLILGVLFIGSGTAVLISRLRRSDDGSDTGAVL